MGMGKKSPYTVPMASCAIHGNSWAVNGNQSYESCIQLLAKSCVQLPAREYLSLLVDYWRSADYLSPGTVNSLLFLHIATWIKDSRATVALQPETVCRFYLSV